MLSLLLLSAVCGLGESIRPRGVRVELASLYNPSSDFSCIDGSGSIPFIQVNDDYCDCDDGSDEPGTSACPEGRFYCENKGHHPLVIPSSRVNDGICDCCDGSDEWQAGSPCQNTCMELGRAAREAAMAEAKVALEGFSIKQGMISEGKVVQEERVARIAEKESLKAELESSREQKRLEKEQAELPEKEALDFYRQLEEEENRKREEEEKARKDVEAEQFFNLLDSNQDGVVSIEELQERQGLDTNKDGSVSEEEAKFFLAGNEHFDLDSFKDTGFVLLKPYLELEEQSTEQPAFTDNPATDEELVEPPAEEFTPPPSPDDPQVYDPWRANQQKEEKDQVEDTYEPETEDYDDGEDEDKDDEEDYDIADTPPEPTVEPKVEEKYDDKTRTLIAVAEEARKRYEDVDQQLRDIDREIKEVKDVLEKDYGYENEFVALSGQCFEYTDNEYVYKMCPFDYSNQRSKNGGSETRLGNWGEWLGPEGDRYSKMKFTGGQQCWNGPTRSATILLHCGTENKLTSVSEPNRCEYEMHFTTPSSCSKPNYNHDEL